MASVPLFHYTDEQLAIKADFENELPSLETLPGAVYKPIRSAGIGWKSDNSWPVSISFESELPFFDVYYYYDNQFRAHGWRKTSLRNKTVYYKKNYYEANIGESDGQQNQYIIYLTWYKAREYPPNAFDSVMGPIFLIIMPCLLIWHFTRLIISNWKRKKRS